MTKARKYIYDENRCAHYHCMSRVVQGNFLFGEDKSTGINYDYRLDWIYERVKELSEIFTIIIGGCSFMHNHFHINLQTRPDLTEALTDREVAQRYFKLCPPEQSKKKVLTPADWKFLEDELIANEKLIKEYRKRIGSLSWFMKTKPRWRSLAGIQPIQLKTPWASTWMYEANTSKSPSHAAPTKKATSKATFGIADLNQSY